MGKRKRKNESHEGQEKLSFDDESKGEGASQALENKADHSSQSGVKKPFSWTPVQLLVVLKELSVLAEAISSKPLDNSSINWNDLAMKVGEKLNLGVTRNQVYEKARRLKEKYIKNRENASCEDPNYFRNKDDKKMFKLSQKIWGAQGAMDSKLNNENCDVPSDDSDDGCKENNHGQIQIPSKSATIIGKRHGEPSFSGVNLNKPDQQSKNKTNTFCEDGSNNADDHSTEQTKSDPKVGYQLNNHHLEDLRSTIEVFKTKQQAILNNLENSCMAVLNHMEAKFLNALNSTVRGSRSPGMGNGTNHFALDVILQDSVPKDNMTYVWNQPVNSESLDRQWQEQHLQELNLTSLKLQLMLEECKREKEKLGKL